MLLTCKALINFGLYQEPRYLAIHLIDEEGVFQVHLAEKLCKTLKKEPIKAYPDSPFDAYCTSHFIRVIEHFCKSKSAVVLLSKFTIPVSSKYVEKLVHYSMGDIQEGPISKSMLRRAVFSALLTPLRQNIGSCFATAPAIVIQLEQIDNLLLDLHEIISTGKMVRTIAGNSFTIPLSFSCGGLVT